MKDRRRKVVAFLSGAALACSLVTIFDALTFPSLQQKVEDDGIPSLPAEYMANRRRNDVATTATTESLSEVVPTSQSVHPQVHPWLVRQQEHPLSPRKCKTRFLWTQNKTRVPETCYPFSTEHICRVAPLGKGPEGPDGYQLLKKIRPSGDDPKRNPRILCLVYTNHAGHDRIRTIVHLWGKRCDGFLAMSDTDDPSIGALRLQHEGPESYDNMWQKTRSILKYAHDHYLDDFDFFHVCGDDVYLVLENMRHYLGSDDVMKLGRHNDTHVPHTFSELKPLLLGAPMYINKNWYACAGGSGYTLNQAALKLYVQEMYSTCRHNVTSSMEDIHLSWCFWQHGIKCSGWNSERRDVVYHGMDANDQASGAKTPLGTRRLKRAFRIRLKRKLEGASRHSFAFHLKSVRFRYGKTLKLLMMQRYEVILYNLCHKDEESREERR